MNKQPCHTRIQQKAKQQKSRIKTAWKELFWQRRRQRSTFQHIQWKSVFVMDCIGWLAFESHWTWNETKKRISAAGGFYVSVFCRLSFCCTVRGALVLRKMQIPSGEPKKRDETRRKTGQRAERTIDVSPITKADPAHPKSTKNSHCRVPQKTQRRNQFNQSIRDVHMHPIIA